MNKFLLIHSSLDNGFAALAGGDKILTVRGSDNPREHGSFLHAAIESLFKDQGWNYSEINAIGVSAGPGSYTGIRVGLAAAKGLAYAWDRPLVLVSNLKLLAATAIDRGTGQRKADDIFVSLIHARQNEYYTGIYDSLLQAEQPDALLVIGEEKPGFLVGKKFLTFGIDTDKFDVLTGIQSDKNITEIDRDSFARVVSKMYFDGRITDAEKATPLYLKDAFVTGNNK